METQAQLKKKYAKLERFYKSIVAIDPNQSLKGSRRKHKGRRKQQLMVNERGHDGPRGY